MNKNKFNPNPNPDNFPEVEIEIPELHKKLTVKTDGSPHSLTEAFAYVASLIAHNHLKDTEAGLTPKSPTHEVVHDADGRYRLKRLRFS